MKGLRTIILTDYSVELYRIENWRMCETSRSITLCFLFSETRSSIRSFVFVCRVECCMSHITSWRCFIVTYRSLAKVATSISMNSKSALYRAVKCIWLWRQTHFITVDMHFEFLFHNSNWSSFDLWSNLSLDQMHLRKSSHADCASVSIGSIFDTLRQTCSFHKYVRYLCTVVVHLESIVE